jgi:hypothetical protein
LEDLDDRGGGDMGGETKWAGEWKIDRVIRQMRE